MKKILKSIITLTAALLCVILLLGCNESVEDETSAATESTSVQTTETESVSTSETESETTEQTTEAEEGLRPGTDSPDGWDEFNPA